MRILLDTNVLLRSIEPGHAHHFASSQAIDTLRQRGHELVTVPQVHYEFWSVATRPTDNNGLGMSTAEAQAELAAIQRLFRLLRDERAIFSIWEHLVSSLAVKGKQTHDARLAVAMQRHAITHLLTFNMPDFARYPLMTTLSPLDVIHGAAPV
ncbi:MAG: PIN domain-containing protein [Planctomycetaceae bacterium]|nr:PIN domain-containing protein [Planctomycetaceae bacterium]